MSSKLERIDFCQPMIGMDVEFFFEKDGDVIGAEKVFDNGELVTDDRRYGKSKFIVDGVQAELNPVPFTCRQSGSKELLHCFSYLKDHMDKKGVSTNFNGVIEVNQKEFDSLSDSSKVFGCMPSFDAYADGAVNKIMVDPKKDLKRSAGGHIHLGGHQASVDVTGGMNPKCLACPLDCKEEIRISQVDIIHEFKASGFNIHDVNDQQKLIDYLVKTGKLKASDISAESKVKVDMDGATKALLRPDLLIPMLDLIVGIPSVLLDRDPNAKVRRKVYGKAGDYRLPHHGLEYRTLSNFWIKSYPLMSLMTGLARTAHLIVADELKNDSGIIAKFFEGIDKKEVQRIINESDYEGARDIFLKIEDKLCQIASNDDNFPITNETLPFFKQFVLNGYKKHFSDDVIVSWERNSTEGWEDWCRNHISLAPDTVKKFITFKKD